MKFFSYGQMFSEEKGGKVSGYWIYCAHNELTCVGGDGEANGASDLHLEPGLPPAIRVRGTLRAAGPPVSGKLLMEAAHEIIGPEGWNDFLARRSYDMSKNLQGVRCRINVLHTSRGVGMAVRLLMGFTATMEKLNLHPDSRNSRQQPRVDFDQRADGLGKILDDGGDDPGDQFGGDAAYRDDRESD